MTRRPAAAIMTAALTLGLLATPSQAAERDSDLSDGLTITDHNFDRHLERISPERSLQEIRIPTPEQVKTDKKQGGDSVVTFASDVLFEFAKADVNPAAQAQITGSVTAAPQGAKVSVGGHTDSIGDDASNLTLSKQRAEAVATLIRAARPDLVLTVEGFGESKPVADNGTPGEKDNPEGRAQNRRVEIRFAG